MSLRNTEIINRQKKFFLSGKTNHVDFRIESLKRLKRTIINRYDDIADAIKKDLHKCDFEIFTTEAMGVLDEINLAVKHLHSWAKPQKVKTPLVHFKARSQIYHEPYGAALIISAWNYPFQIAMNPVIGAIAAGNCCIIKPSELAPHTSGIIAQIIKESFVKEHCTVIEGGVDETTELLNERFDIIHYTGNSRVGRIIAQAAAKNLTPVILELGGKSPCIVDDTANIEVSARRIVWGKFLNAGQTCVAPDYLVVHKAVKERLIKAIIKQIELFYGNNPENSKDYGRIINQRHFNRLTALINNGKVTAGGRTDKENLYIEPTIIEHVTWDDPIMQEEIFGPILPVLEFSTIDEVISMVNAKEKPLALYYFSKDKKNISRISNEAHFGGGCINTTVIHTSNLYLPFGGIGESGMGNYHGKWSFEAFSHKKSMINKSLIIDPKLIYPPYNNNISIILKKMYRSNAI